MTLSGTIFCISIVSSQTEKEDPCCPGYLGTQDQSALGHIATRREQKEASNLLFQKAAFAL